MINEVSAPTDTSNQGIWPLLKKMVGRVPAALGNLKLASSVAKPIANRLAAANTPNAAPIRCIFCSISQRRCGLSANTGKPAFNETVTVSACASLVAMIKSGSNEIIFCSVGLENPPIRGIPANNSGSLGEATDPQQFNHRPEPHNNICR